MSARPDFADAVIKCERADVHIAAVQAEITRFLATEFYRIRFEHDLAKGTVLARFDSLHQPDKRFSLILGDAVSNLRSTLDYVAGALLYPITGTREGHTFPFADDQTGFEGIVNKGPIKGCGPAVVSLLLNEVQAYESGVGRTLWALNKFRNIDKHRLLIATVSLAGVKFSCVTANRCTFNDISVNFRAGQGVYLIEAPPGFVEFTKKPEPLFSVMITEPPQVGEAVAFLHDASSSIKRLVASLKAMYV